jgi:hypothetical protein
MEHSNQLLYFRKLCAFVRPPSSTRRLGNSGHFLSQRVQGIALPFLRSPPLVFHLLLVPAIAVAFALLNSLKLLHCIGEVVA